MLEPAAGAGCPQGVLRWVACLTFAACATPGLPAPVTNATPARLPLVVRGPAANERRARRCTPEEALFGPVTAAASWGRGWVACRTGPSPKLVFERAFRDDRALRGCLGRLGVTWLDGHVRLAGTGTVVEIVIDELEPEGLDVRPCLLRVAGYRLVHAGCEVEPRLHYVRF